MLKKVLLLIALVPAAALGTLIGDVVNVRYQLGLNTTLDSVLVGTGVEIACPGPQNICTVLTLNGQSLNFGANTIRYENATATGTFSFIVPNGFRFESLDTDPIIGVTLNTNIEDLDLFRVSYATTSVNVEMNGLTIGAGSFFEIGLLSINDIPEPGTIWMFAVGIGLGYWRGKLRRVGKTS